MVERRDDEIMLRAQECMINAWNKIPMRVYHRLKRTGTVNSTYFGPDQSGVRVIQTRVDAFELDELCDGIYFGGVRELR
jgi:hypothetical protein